MHRWPVGCICGRDEGSATPVFLGIKDGWGRGERGNAVCRRGGGAGDGRGAGDEDGGGGGAPGDGGLELSDDVVHDVIAAGVVGCCTCDDDRVVQCGDARPRCVLAQGGHACEHLEDGGVDVAHAPGPVRGGDEGVHGLAVADCGVEGVVGVGRGEDEGGIRVHDMIWPRAV